MNSSQRVTWINHVGVRLLNIDLREASREEQYLALEAYAIVLKQATDLGVSVLVQGDENLDFYPDLATRTKAVMAGQESKVRRSALVGFSGIARVAFDGFFSASRLLGKDLTGRGRHFDGSQREAALQWLVAD